jgi:predicted PurR-regulated permease PerM
MNMQDLIAADRQFQKNAITAFIQSAALAALLLWCFRIVAPFVSLVVWAMIIAVALYPVHVRLTEKLGGRSKLSATLFVVAGLIILLVPVALLMESGIEGLKTAGGQLQSGVVSIEPPDPSVAQWPLIGHRVYDLWSAAAANLLASLASYDQVGLAEANLYPSFSISGSRELAAAGNTDTTRTGNSGFGALFAPESLTYSVGPSLVWPFLNYGR